MLDWENIAAILSRDSWEDVLDGLAHAGLSYERKGGGAVIKSESGEIKASSVGKYFSLFFMEKRLGALPGSFATETRACGRHVGQLKSGAGGYASLEALAKGAASQRSLILRAVRNDDDVRLEALCGGDAEAAYFRQRFKWLVDHGRKALPDASVCEMWIRGSLFEPVECGVERWNLYREANDGTARGYFREYQSAIEADSFQVICAAEDKSMRFHDLEGFPEGIPAPILPEFFGRLLSLNQRGEMIAFKPLSSKWLYIFVHNVTRAGLEKLLGLGVSPAYIQEISEHLHQVIVKIPKTGNAETDRILDVEMSRALNLIAGDCMPGSRRPHFAPGFTNWRGVERNGAYPISGSVSIAGTACGALAEYGIWALENRPAPITGQFTPDKPVQADPIALYQVHLRDILRVRRMKPDEADPSSLEMAIATRLRGTGHPEEEVAEILAATGRKFRPKAHNWDDYSRRTARKAFSDDRFLFRYERWIPKWRELEISVASLPFRSGAIT